ncbi:MAG: hypothetical protein IJF05_06575 [Clostridia bacterium]|nr:hypothetical protein [Clostridia bacterium]
MRAFKKDRFLTGNGYRVSPIEYVSAIIVVLMLVFLTTGLTDLIHEKINHFVMHEYGELYGWRIIGAAWEWFTAKIEGTFFLFVPIVWIFKLLCTVVALVIQLAVSLLLAIGHLILFLLGVVVFYLLLYFGPPAITVFLIVRACRNEDVGGLWLIISLFSTVLYYVMMMSAPWMN